MHQTIKNKHNNLRSYSSTDPIEQHLAAEVEARIFVDFDYTLFWSNSTEAFLNSGRPGFVTALVLRILSVLAPWSLASKDQGSFLWRDGIRIWAIILIVPWTLLLFRRKAPALFERFQNPQLVGLIDKLDLKRVVIVTNGYVPFVRMILRGSSLAGVQLVGSSLWQPTRVRRDGKLVTLSEVGLVPVREKDVVITDSIDDADLLAAVDHAYLVAPDGMENHSDLAGVYVPFFYSARVKRSPEFVVKQMFLEEMPIILLATVFFQPFSVSLWIAAILFFVGFLAAYEIGYAENDRIGYLNETRPKLAEDYEKFKDVELEPAAWIWVVGLSIGGVWMLGKDTSGTVLSRLGIDLGGGAWAEQATLVALWIAIILAGRVLFFLYNHMPMVWRVFGYILLHFGKYFSLVVIFPSQPAGYALLCAQIVRTWSLYAIRRSGGDMELVASQSIRLAYFILFLIAFELATPDVSALRDWHTWLIMLFCIVRAGPEARRKLFNRQVLRSGMRR